MSFVEQAGQDGNAPLKAIFDMAGVACLLISAAWLAQLVRFSGADAGLAQFTWAMLSAFTVGIGIGCFLVGRYWLPRAQDELGDTSLVYDGPI